MIKISLILLCLFACLGCRETPRQKVLDKIEGEATYYGKHFHGKETKSGETFNMNEMTAAHATFPMGTKVKVTNLENNQSVIVTVNDKPAAQRKSFIDLSRAAFRKICHLDSGVIKVKMEVLAWGDKK